ncbi:FtsK/SpoIIIE domain-containing protein [Knoellia sinensis]|nr:FtsK/SpoIIIE domain-containing protein [Knoellia sinensis]
MPSPPSAPAASPTLSFDVTVRAARRRDESIDVRITAPAGSTVADVLPLLADITGTVPARIACRGVGVAPDALLGMPPLVHGATLVLDDASTPSTSPTPPTSPSRTSSAPMDLVVVAGPDAGRRVPIPRDGIVVGRSAGLGLSLADVRLSRGHARITPADNGIHVVDLGSTNGTRCGEMVLRDGASAHLDGSEAISIGGSMLRVMRSLGTTSPTASQGDGHVAVNRSPRPRPPELTVAVSAPTPPTPPHAGRIPWVAAALPLPFAGVLAAFFGPQMLAFALLSPLMLVGNVLGDRWGRRRDYARELAAHDDELAQRESEFATLRRLERDQRWADVPDPAAVLTTALGPGTRLWERRSNAADVGRVRLGVGELPSRVGWAPAGGGPVQHTLLADLPVEVDLRAVGGLGIAGPRDEVDGIVRHVLGQVAVLHSPRDVHIIVQAEGPGHALSWAKWLPHTTAYGERATCLDALRHLVATREGDGERGRQATHPAVLFVLPDAGADLGAGELADLLERGHALGVWSVVGAPTAASLPASCRAVVGVGQGAADGTSRLDVDGAAPVPSFRPDVVGSWWGERVGRALAPLVDGSGRGDTVPDSVDLLDLLPGLTDGVTISPTAVARQWRAGNGAPRARLGRLAGDDWVVDLAADGPHLLVGGTTGSGKSELLRTLVTSLALHSSPADMTFVLVDYKGGSAFGECADLPHTVGLVTNLDEGLARRALVSLTAEIHRREALLAASGARDFDDHRRRAGGLPRLVIVIDEFRLLAEELPDFVDGVVSLAAVGRSLGVHLVLATQRPAGAITADIQANVNLRIAMRVRDVADSTDVIGAPNAARLPVDRPGRGIACGGDGELVEFQAARVGAGSATATARLAVLGADGRPLVVPGEEPRGGGSTDGGLDAEPTGLAALASAARTAAGHERVPTPHRPWLPPLADELSAADVGPDALGLLDDPSRQRQAPFTHGADGHWLIAGGPRSGRTSALRTILAAHVSDPACPDHVYVIDTTGELADLESLPHVGAVVRGHDASRLRRLLDRLQARSTRGFSAPGTPVLLLVDGWDRLASDSEVAVDGIRDAVLDLLRSGESGLRAVITGDRSVLSSRLTAIATETFLLPLADPADATYAGLSRRDLPSSRVPGRALWLRDRVEVQFALRDPGAEAAPRGTSLGEPFRLPQLPDLIDHADLLARADGPDLWAGPGPVPFGLSAETGSVAAWDPEQHGRRMLVLGHARSGRSTTLATLARSLLMSRRPVAVIERRGGRIGASAEVDPGEIGPSGLLVIVDPWDAESLIAAKRAHPDLAVLVDDADAIDGTPVEPVLTEIVSLVDRDGGLVVAVGTPMAAVTQFRGLLHAVARAQAGILLAPRTPSDGEALGIRAPRGLASVPGRALLVSGRHQTEVQVARSRSRLQAAA